jgi:alpha-beta hydrolase superfamily lysophospholipase
MTENGIIHEYLTLYNEMGESIRGDLRFRRTLEEKPIIIVCHSFMAFKDWGFFPFVAESLANAGYIALSFNFSHDGVRGDGDRITEFEKFERNTFSKELDDLRVVVDAVWSGQVGGGIVARSKIIMLGHSRGGAIAILHTSVDARVKGLITWSTIDTFDRWTQHQKEKWKNLGYLPLAKDSSVSPLRLGIDLLNDLESNRVKLDLKTAASRIQIPWLLLHGKTDVTVPPHESENLFAAANKSLADLILLDHVGHLYNAATRDEDNYRTINRVIDLTLNWIKTKIK